jgi:hypothetical protein
LRFRDLGTRVSDGWGVGVALQAFAGTIPDQGYSWTTVGGTVAFSATYN